MGYLTIIPLVAIVFASLGSSEGGSIKLGPYTYEWFGNKKVWWDLASFICKVKGGRLVDIESEAENNLVLKTIQILGYYEGVWIGKHGHFNQSVLMLEENGGYSNWATGEPSKHGDSKVCVVIDARRGEWYTAPCSWSLHPWLCKYGEVATISTPTANATTTTTLMTSTYEPTGNETSTVQYSTTNEPTGNETSTVQYSTTNEPTGNGTSTVQYSSTYKPTENEPSPEGN